MCKLALLYLLGKAYISLMLDSSSLIAENRQVAGKSIDLGPVGARTAAVIREIREQRRLKYAELSRILDGLGRPIPALGLRRIEAGERRVDVDDLVALALALEVSPLRLLLPVETSPLVPGGDEYSAGRIWNWGIGTWPLGGDEVTFVRDSHPLKWAATMGGRESGDATALLLGAHTIQQEISREQQIAHKRAGD